MAPSRDLVAVLETRGLATALLRTRPNWWCVLLGHERQPRSEEPALQHRRLEGRPQASSGWRRSSRGAWLKPKWITFGTAMDARIRRSLASMGKPLAHHAFALLFRPWMPKSGERHAWAANHADGHGSGLSAKPSRATRRHDSPTGCLNLSTVFAPACGHMTDRRRYRDSAATRPPSESRGDIRYLLCLPEIVPRILHLTPAFRGSFRFEHYPLTGAAESS